MLAAPVFAFSPILIAIVLSPFIDSFNESEGIGALPWLTFFTAPIGLVVFVVGIVLALTGRGRTQSH